MAAANKRPNHLGLDVHKDSITIATAEPGSKGEIRLFGTITNDIDRLEKALSRIRKAHPRPELDQRLREVPWVKISPSPGPC